MADESAPKPGHFLPGGDGDRTTADNRTTPDNRAAGNPAAGDPTAGNPTADNRAVGNRAVGGSAPLAAPTPRLGRDDRPAHPQLSGSRIDSRRTTLSGTRLGPAAADDRAAAAYREVFHPEPIPFVPKKRSKGLIALIVAAALLVLGGGATFAVKVLSNYDGFVANPLGTPSATPGDGASGGPTTTAPVGKGTPDADVVGKNAIYGAGKLPVVNCPEPAFRPTSKENVRSYYQALTACMDKAWKPLVTKAGFEFRSPRLIVFDDGEETACGVQQDLASYCQDDQGGSVTMPWQKIVEDYPTHRAATRAQMAQAFGFVYGVHVQNLTGMADATGNLADAAANKAAELEQDRRASLQASCFGAVFFGAARASFPLRGELLQQWNDQVRRSGDEYSKDKVRDHGSSKSYTLWMNQGFATTNPAACNTFGAASAKVS
ncbi:putative metalloprotease [Kribbella aluminosa]|uniref:Metalloprotease n=1 Tax=Kribbella aluminosa TaxID=416017 RepID=A0ABS4UTT4_9ACTN|nr:neutral zinc metallopeptidase [Kribbella aluminosa]MBP2355055.1 putative metalloprotease [Kribbella aluminosa]